MADDIANVLWQMFQTTEADVINLFFVHARLMLLPITVYVAGVIPHDLLQCFELADVNAKWLMELPLHDGTWLMLLSSG